MSDDQKKYSVYDIDRMRCAVEWLVNIGGKDDEIARTREEKLRTYMLNGTSPDELEEEANRRCGVKIQTFSNYPQPFSSKDDTPHR